MRSILSGLASFIFVLHSTPSYAVNTEDLGFEAGKVGDAPAGWFVPPEGWTAELTEENAASGARAVKLSKTGESKAPFGNLMQSIPAENYSGRKVTLTAKIMVLGEGRGQMWLREDLSNGGIGAFDNMDDRPIMAGGWKNAKIEAEIDADAAMLNIGFISKSGSATLFIDDVKMLVSDDRIPMQQPSPAKALSARGLENLTAAAKLLSYVRFFHPSDQVVGVASWDHFAVDLMERCESATDAGDLARILIEAMEGIAPTVEVWAGPLEKGPSLGEIPSRAKAAAMWQHYGAGRIALTNPQQIYRSVVKKTPLDTASGGHDSAFVVKSLGGDLSCRLPIAVFADDIGTLPHGKTPQEWATKTDLVRLSGLNRSTRLAGVALGWGVFQHFYPYFDVVETDWEAALPVALKKAAQDIDEMAYLQTLREMIAKLDDGHGNVTNKALTAASMLPLAIEWAGKDLVVVGKPADAPETVGIGDTIVSLDGTPVEECYNKVSKWISAATEGWRRYVSCRFLTVNLPTKDPVTIVLRKPDGKTATVEMARVREPVAPTATEKKPDNGVELAPGVVYFDLNGAQIDALKQAMPKLSAAKAIIFDLRGYPGSAGVELMQHLIDKSSTSARWCVPIVCRPDLQEIEWEESGRWQLTPQQPRLKAKIAFVTDGRAISYAESILGIVEFYKLGEIVGSTTAGTNGNVNPFTLPGGYSVSWTGMKVLKHDGSQHHGIGIPPTVSVTATANGIAQGRDEVLEKAVEVMKDKIAGTG